MHPFLCYSLLTYNSFSQSIFTVHEIFMFIHITDIMVLTTTFVTNVSLCFVGAVNFDSKQMFKAWVKQTHLMTSKYCLYLILEYVFKNNYCFKIYYKYTVMRKNGIVALSQLQELIEVQ